MKKLLLALVALGFCAHAALAATPPAYFVDEAKLPFNELANLPSQREWGVHNGAGYRIEVPQQWNGKLVIWAHGYRGTGLELTVDNHPLRAFLLANGYAWAASSYSRNAYDPAQGAKDSHALTQLFNGRFGRPSRVYITGASMGGHVTGIVAEQWPQSYDGAMPICGVLGDYELFDYFLDHNVAAQTLSGQNKRYPYGDDYLSVTVPATKAALGPAFPFALNAAGQNFKALMQQRSGGVRPLFEQGWLYWNGLVPGDFLFGLGVGNGTLPRQPGVAVQNVDVVYQFDANPALTAAEDAFNVNVQRVTADPQARRRNGLANVTPTTGDLRIPMLSLHTLGDLFVPFHMEQVYARRVAEKGNSARLVQRATRDVGHCSFAPAELVTTFVDLVKWVEAGVKPAGDAVLDPQAVADPAFGCKFTDKTAPRIWDQPGLGILKPAACPVP
ncbi:prolyl oligopeptidase family serine peptidase [Roseateles violae]|uniref:Prolyl oligopeptidase family serine peptidase n=1 Tax=Roseateles violae TaxID=3058042 RepID=A0ABT8DV53_9BURK|nr:prolyl oligopeptidase family serine peptidase [Pelomonas sp. PFR6]MDN3920174.1 prolyl oligopeptidase family serine peptidase [Pelomonas sp. PFR6]